ncbi:MAG: cysteine protease [Prevotella sp.]|nr:cysteine protease [Prevotella sp.]
MSRIRKWKTGVLMLVAALVLTSCFQQSKEKLPTDSTEPDKEQKATGKAATEVQMTDEVRLLTTPVKNQGRSSLCWIYAMLATIETEHLQQGDSVNLSPIYLTRQWLSEQAERLYLERGKRGISQRGMAPMTLHLISRYGLHPYDYYHAHQHANMNVLWKRVEQLTKSAVARRQGLERYKDDLTALLDESLGFMPRYVHMLGAEYTSEEFGRSMCMDDEYEALTSFTHHPFGERFRLEVADNQMNDKFLNVPLDTLMAVIERSLREGHPVCWEGDISEDGFSFKEGFGRLKLSPSEKENVSEERQRQFERFETTDDHCMELVGIAHDQKGERYFIAKNSWGKRNPYGGFMYLSEDYVRMKTICVVLPKECAGSVEEKFSEKTDKNDEENPDT